MTKEKFKSLTALILKVALSASLILWLIQSGKINFTILSKILDVQFFLVGLSLIGISLILGTERWRQFLKIQDCELPRGLALKLTLVGLFFNYVMPGGVGGDLVKGYYITKFSHTKRTGTVMTIILDRLIGLLAILLISLGAMLLNFNRVMSEPKLKIILILVTSLTLALLGFWLLIFSRRLYNWSYIPRIIQKLPKSHLLMKIYHSLGSYSELKNVFFSTLMISTLAQLFVLAFYIYAGYHMGFQASIPTYLLAVPISFVVQAIPISPGGIGVGQAATFFLFNILEPDSGLAGASTTTAHQFIGFIFGLLGAIFYIILSHHIKTKAMKEIPS